MSVARLRKAGAADVPTLTVLINLAYRVEDFFIDGNRTDETELAAILAAHEFLLAEDAADGSMIGAVLIEFREGGKTGYFGMLSVHPDRQKGGLGRQLIAAAEDRCRAAGCTRMTLQCVDLRTELPPYYEKLGYRTYATAPFPDVQKKKRACGFILMGKDL
jgi:GNAT superfamily N-acetyltransferase